jgi:ribonuclease T2
VEASVFKLISRSFVLLAAVAILTLGQAGAQDPRQNKPGEFDFYVLALSWSPTFCAEARDRSPDRVPQPQCGERPYSFVVHGLWPQYEQGFPEYCQVPAPRLSRQIVSGMLDLMPSPRLIFHQWERHGVCLGVSPSRYFETVRKARAMVRIPDGYLDLAAPLTVAPAAVEAAFIKANPGLTAGSMAVRCSGNRLSEVRVCMSTEFGFRNCPEVARRACRRDQVIMPPVRGRQAAAAVH